MIITAGKFKGINIKAPDEKITRPTLSKVRMSVFNTLQSMIDFENKSFLDMFSGSGIMGMEAYSRGFSNVVMIEKNKKVIPVIKSNLKNLKSTEEIKVMNGDSLKLVPAFYGKFDVIYIDPPYFSGIYEKSLEAVKSISEGIVILEHVTDVDFCGYELVKQKKYGDKFISFLTL